MDRSEEKKAKDRKQTVRLLAMISQFGINMLVPIAMCFFTGMYLDKRLGTSYITIILFFVGALAGFRNIYMFAKRYAKNDPERMTGITQSDEEKEDDQP